MVLVILTYWSCDTQLYYTQLWQLWWPLYKLSPLWRRSWRVHPEDSPLWKPSRSLNVKKGPVVLHGLYTVSFRQERSVQRQPSEARRSWTSWDVGKQQEKLKIDMMKNGVWFDGNLRFTEPKAEVWKMLNGFCWCFHQQIVKLSFPKFVVKEGQSMGIPFSKKQYFGSWGVIEVDTLCRDRKWRWQTAGIRMVLVGRYQEGSGC